MMEEKQRWAKRGHEKQKNRQTEEDVGGGTMAVQKRVGGGTVAVA